MRDPMLVNVTYIVGQRVVRARPCDLCGGEGAFKTWAVGLEEGGQRTDQPCRQWTTSRRWTNDQP